MRVCLIIPPTGFELDDRVFPPLGVLKVAAVLEQEGHAVTVLDLLGEKKLPIVFPVADVYGITATTPQMPDAARIAERLRWIEPDSRLILGGPHVTLMLTAAKSEEKRKEFGRAAKSINALTRRFHTIVSGDGERAVLKAIKWSAPDVIDADDRSSTLFLQRGSLGELPPPARHLIDQPSYRFLIDGEPAASLIGQLGCPFGCTFCGGRNSASFRTIRTRPVASIIREVESLYATYGYRAFFFLDDELNVTPAFPELLHALQDLQDRQAVNFRFRGLVKSELLTDELARLMRQTGFREILSGFESGDERILLNMNKHATRDDNTRCVEIARKAGLRIKALMSLGHAGESPESIEATRQWLLDVRPDQFDATIITVYPGTPYYDEAIETSPNIYTYTAPKTGDRLHARNFDQFSDQPFYKGIPGQYESFVHTDYLSANELVAARDALESELRCTLKIPYPTSAAERQYEHSMGAR